MDRTVTARFGDGEHDAVSGIERDLAEALIAALCGERNVEPPQHADNFNRINKVTAQTSRLIQHLEAFRELCIVAADETSPYADRQSIAVAAAVPPSRLYRILERHGRPKDRRNTPPTPDAEQE
ncbi:hypothetical protein Q3A86_33220 [Streptomyces sp. NBUA17]|uniref:hypothetical protein n=1 Tax=Streptomyces sp. NBUA17 TaxID=3062275 RepID=UPI0037DA4146